MKIDVIVQALILITCIAIAILAVIVKGDDSNSTRLQTMCQSLRWDYRGPIRDGVMAQRVVTMPRYVLDACAPGVSTERLDACWIDQDLICVSREARAISEQIEQ